MVWWSIGPLFFSSTTFFFAHLFSCSSTFQRICHTLIVHTDMFCVRNNTGSHVSILLAIFSRLFRPATVTFRGVEFVKVDNPLLLLLQVSLAMWQLCAESPTHYFWVHAQDLSKLGRDMRRTVLIDNNHLAMLASPRNCTPRNPLLCPSTNCVYSLHIFRLNWFTFRMYVLTLPQLNVSDCY